MATSRIFIHAFALACVLALAMGDAHTTVANMYEEGGTVYINSPPGGDVAINAVSVQALAAKQAELATAVAGQGTASSEQASTIKQAIADIQALAAKQAELATAVAGQGTASSEQASTIKQAIADILALVSTSRNITRVLLWQWQTSTAWSTRPCTTHAGGKTRVTLTPK